MMRTTLRRRRNDCLMEDPPNALPRVANGNTGEACKFISEDLNETSIMEIIRDDLEQKCGP